MARPEPEQAEVWSVSFEPGWEASKQLVIAVSEAH